MQLVLLCMLFARQSYQTRKLGHNGKEKIE